MKKYRKKIISIFTILILSIQMILQMVMTVNAEEVQLQLQSPSYVLMEASTGKIMIDQNADEKRSPASITKIMTLLLIFEALDQGKIQLQDTVTTSAHAKGMGGSQVFLEEGEQQSVETLIKCIVVASGNDASVAMAEYLEGTEDAFVDKMNQKAQVLDMVNTHFEDCCGLSNSDNHYTSAKDVAIMTRELITNHPEVFQYSGIWMEDITHVTAKGSSTFTLSSTNKLLKQYEWTTGLKTGSTQKAKYCLSATAKKNDIELIAVIMAAPDYKVRFAEAKSLLDYGYAHCQMLQDDNKDILEKLPVTNGTQESVAVQYKEPFRYLDMTGSTDKLEKTVVLPEAVNAPIIKGETAGEAVYKLGGIEVGRCPIIYQEDIDKAKFPDYLQKVVWKFLL